MGNSRSNGNVERSEKTFRVNLFVNEDGTFTAIGENLRGLVLETGNLEEMEEELLRLTPRLLRANHRLSDDEVDNVLIDISTYRMVNGEPKPLWKLPKGDLRLMWQNSPPIGTVT